MTLAAQQLVPSLPRPAPATPAVRVCHVASGDLWAGAEAQVATIASYLMRRTDVDLRIVLLNDGRLAHELRRFGATVHVIDERRTGSLGIVRQLEDLLREQRVNVIHTHRYKESILGALAARRAGVPHIIRTVHGVPEPLTGWAGLKMRAYERVDKTVLWWWADLVVAVSRRMAEDLRRKGYRPTAVTCIHNGVDLGTVRSARSREDVRRELGIAQDAWLTGTAGRLAPVKGHDTFLRAAALILEQRPNARFVVAGGGPLREELQATAARLGLDRACLFLGPRSDVFDLVAAMDTFVLPSMDEGVPMAILEAMALRTPVVASGVGGIPEILRHRETGLLVPSRDERALADTCLELSRHPELARSLAADARTAVEEEFSHEANGRALVSAYRSLAVAPQTWRQQQTAAPAPRLGSARLAYELLRRVAAWITRHMYCEAERARMRWIRRSPKRVVDRLRSARSVLVVCHGNIIRSPFAAALIQRELSTARALTVRSRGLEATAGRPAHQRAVLAAAGLGLDLASHAAEPLSAADLAESDVVLVMETPHLVSMRKRFPDARRKTFLLTCLAPGTALDVNDPVEGDERIFQACFEHIARAVQPVVQAIAEAPPRGGHACG